MPQREFELFLSLLAKLLKLSSRETAEIADEICDHLEERYSELLAAGASPEDAVQKALAEFEDAHLLASRLTTIIRQRKRRRIMTGMLGTAAAAAGIIATAAFWPDAPRPQTVTGAAVAADTATARPSSEVISIETGQFLPPGLVKPFEADLTMISLDDAARLIGAAAGMPVYLDLATLADAGVGPEVEVSARVKDVPCNLALDRILENVNGVKLGWFLEDGVLAITTSEQARDREWAVSIDIQPLLKRGFTAPVLTSVLSEMTEGPWDEIDGEGGRISIFNNVLTVRQSFENLLQVRALLQALESGAREVHVAEPAVHRELLRSLDQHVSVQFNNVDLSDVLDELAKQSGTLIELDVPHLQDAGVDSSTLINLSHNDVSLRFLLSLPINGIQCAVVPRAGRLVLTTEESAREGQTTVVYDIRDLVGTGESSALVQMILGSTDAYWISTTGEGGDLIVPIPGMLCVRQSQSGQDEVRNLIAEHRTMLAAAEPAPPEDPSGLEIRYYRLSEKTADDLMVTIPKFVAPSTWATEADPAQPGLIQKVYVGSTPAVIGGGGMGSGMGGMGGGMGGMGGGGFFQMGMGGMGGAGGGGVDVPQGVSNTDTYAVLVIRQTRAVHGEIRRFIKELVFGEVAESQSAASIAFQNFTWGSKLEVQPAAAPVAPVRGEDPRGTSTKGARAR